MKRHELKLREKFKIKIYGKFNFNESPRTGGRT